MLPVNLLMLSELKLVNVSESLRCLFACFTSSVGCLGSNNVGGCCKVCKSFGTAGVIFCLLVSSRCWFPCPWWYQECVVLWIDYQLLQSPLTATSLKVLLDGGPMGVQHFSSVFPVVSDGTISRFSLATRCSWCSAGVLEGSVTWSQLSVSPPFALFVPCAAGMRRGHGCSLWPQGVSSALRVGRLTSNCSTQCLMRQSSLAWHQRVRATRAKCEVSILRTKLGSFFITLARFSRHA